MVLKEREDVSTIYSTIKPEVMKETKSQGIKEEKGLLMKLAIQINNTRV